MRLRELRDIFLHQDIYIIGSGPTSNIFPFDFLEDKVCISLNDAYKIHPAVTPVAFMHHEVYSRTGLKPEEGWHPNFRNIKYPIVKASGKKPLPDELIDWDNPHFYYFDWSHSIEDIWSMTKESNHLYYTPEGCSLHAAMQVAWIMGARNVFILGCDSRMMGGEHYAQFDKEGIRTDNARARAARNYDSYVYGTLIVQEFLARKGVQVFNVSPIVGYHLVDYQYDFLRGKMGFADVLEEVRKISKGD